LKIKLLLLLVCFSSTLFVAAPSHAQEVWEKKPYQEWSLKESLKILTDSPWAQTNDGFKDAVAGDNIRDRLAARNDPYPSGMAISIRLRSSLLIRQAFVRQKQLTIKYDKMKPADKEKFDAEVKEFLECPECGSYYIVTLDSRFHKMRRDIDPAKFSLAALQEQTFLLNDKEQWRPCIHVREENQELLFFFKRLDENEKSLITPENKFFGFTMTGTVKDGQLLAGASFVFEVSTITVNGEIAF
jgi:hypothetical protein